MSSRATGRHADGLIREKSPRASIQRNSRDATLPHHRGGAGDIEHNGRHHHKKRRRGKPQIRQEGESGRRGVHPFQFLRIVWRSTSWLSRAVNILWPIVPIAIAICYVPSFEDQHKVKFGLAYVAMIPCANLIGFAGQELARKMPHVLGVLTETTIASIVEIILFMVLLSRYPTNHNVIVLIQGAILGSILATMLLCLGLCFIAAGMRREEASFAETITEAGSGLLLTAGVGLAVPSIFERSVSGLGAPQEEITAKVLTLSHGVAILLLIAYAIFIWFQTRTHHGLFTDMFEHDERRDADQHKDQNKNKLTLTECILALVISVALVTVLAIQLVEEIEPLIEETTLTDPFVGLILIPLVEKAAEHLTAIDEAWDDQMNFALTHCIGSTLQTALLNTPLVVIVGWGLGYPMSLDFEIFDVVMLILAIITVGNFLRDQKSNYLEGFLCVIVYAAIAVAAYLFPKVHHATGAGEGSSGETAAHAIAKLAGL